MEKLKSFLRPPVLFGLLLVLLMAMLVVVSALTKKPKIQPQPSILTPEEISYKDSFPQDFTKQPGEFGSLVVDSNPQEARVTLDIPDEEVPQEKNFLPTNLTPFKVARMPVGSYTLMASKDGYNFKEIVFEIKPNQVTRLYVLLETAQGIIDPRKQAREWITKLPISSRDYVLEYDPSNETIKATVFLKTNSASETQLETEEKMAEIKRLLYEMGVSLSTQKVDWVFE